jgi:hypothetical protein
MKLGKRRQVAQVPGVPGVTIPVTRPSGSRRRPARAASAPADPSAAVSAAPSFSAPVQTPAADSWTASLEEQDAVDARDEPVVEGEAVELPVPPATAADPMPFPVAGEPVAVVTPGAGPAPVTTLGDSGEAFASGHAAAPGPSWQEPVMAMANERPELVVAAAFVGGVLAALILRRLGR